MTMARGQRAERLGRFRGGSEASRGSLRLVEGFLKRRLRADSCGFADELGLLLLHGLPGREDHFFAGDFVEIAFDAFLILRGDALEFAMDVGVLGGFGGPVFLEILPLVGLVGIDGGLANGGVAQHFVDRNAGGIESHEDRGAPHFVREATKMVAREHVRHFANAVAHARRENSCGAVDIGH
jgi:hypothetical protein